MFKLSACYKQAKPTHIQVCSLVIFHMELIQFTAILYYERKTDSLDNIVYEHNMWINIIENNADNCTIDS